MSKLIKKILSSEKELQRFANNWYCPGMGGWKLWVEQKRDDSLSYSHQTGGTSPNPSNYEADEEIMITDVFWDISGASLGEIDEDCSQMDFDNFVYESTRSALEAGVFDNDIQIPRKEEDAN